MNTIRRIAKNTGMLVAGQFAGQMFSFIYVTCMARYLGPSNFGIIAFALAFTAIFSVFADFGLQQLMIRELARELSLTVKYLANVSAMKLFLVIAAFTMITLGVNLMGYPKSTVHIVYFIGLTVFFSAYTTMFYSIFQANERMEYQAMGQLLYGILMLLGIALAIYLKLNLINFIFIYILSSAVLLLYNIIIFATCFRETFLSWISRGILEFDRDFWKTTIKKVFPFGLSAVFVVSFFWADSVMLSFMKGDKILGGYNIVYKMVIALLFIPYSFINAVYPVTSQIYTSKELLRKSLEKSFKFLAIVGIPLGVGVTLLAKKLVFFILGTAYNNSIMLLQILIWSVVLIFLDVPFGNLLNSTNRQSLIAKATFVYVVFNISVNLIFIPRYGALGASVVNVLTQLLGSGLIFFWSFKAGYSIFDKYFLRVLTKVTFASIVMGFLILFLRQESPLVVVPLSLAVYVWTLYLIRGIDGNDWRLLVKIFYPQRDSLCLEKG
jgi:O-antigen/teichoic acid export membrane protein